MSRMPLLLSILLCFASSSTAFDQGCAALSSPAHVLKFNYSDVAVLVPIGVQISTRKNLPDFDVYDFEQEHQKLLSAYVGHDPDFHMFSYHKVVKTSHRIEAGLKITDIVYETTPKGATREEFVQEGSTFNYIHFFYENVPVELAKEADRIIASTIRVH